MDGHGAAALSAASSPSAPRPSSPAPPRPPALLLPPQVFNAEAGYYYNAVHRWYYDTKSKMYYGGEPVAWTAKPDLPAAARYEAQHPAAAPPAAAARPKPPAAAAAAAARAPTMGQRVAPKHPMGNVGGFQMPDVGDLGGAKGVGHVKQQQAAAAGDAKVRVGALERRGRVRGVGITGRVASLAPYCGVLSPIPLPTRCLPPPPPPNTHSLSALQRKRDKGGGEELPPEEVAALAAREEARKRVQQRSMAFFGLK